MKSLVHIILSISLVTSTVNPSAVSLGILSLILGKVTINKFEEHRWARAELKSTVHTGDQLKTATKSRCEVKLSNNKIIRIGEVSIMQFSQYMGILNNISVSNGNLWINLIFPDSKGSFKVRTPTAVAAVRGTVYRLSCDANQTSFRVYDGSVTVSPLDETGIDALDTAFTVNSGDELVLVKDFNEYKQQQRAAFKSYLDYQQLGLEEYAKQQEEFFQEFKRKEEETFKELKGYYVAHEKFNQAADQQLDWVKWNLERDEILNRQD